MSFVPTRVAAAITLSLIAGGCAAPSQPSLPAVSGSNAPAAQEFGVAASDVDSAQNAKILSYHLMRPRSRPPLARVAGDTKIQYPGDLIRKKGPIMTTAASFNIYVNCKAGGQSCWGDVEDFEKNLTGSRFTALLKQYTGSSPRGYTFGGSFSVKYRTFTKLLYSNDLMAVLHAALIRNGRLAGYKNLYHIFLPAGYDTCFDRSRSCYSPDHPRDFDFCAYHEIVKFEDVRQNVVVSVEPYQKISFCASRSSPGASALTNSTASTLGHEIFESITDPGPAFAWFNFIYDDEMADLCEALQWKIEVGPTRYSIQPMYSNKYHACADGP
ncbi:MAG TPA: hypothetical protein VGG51_10420 [Candidatus Cybelea sp.]|jgi:hypothetical protein